MTVTVEAWSSPVAGPMVKKDFNVEFKNVQFELAKSEATDGIITVDRSTVSRLIDSDNNEVNLLRVFKDGHNCQSFFAQNVRVPYGATGQVQVAGASIHSELGNAVILPQNYPENTDPDFEYQQENVLENPGAEGGDDTWVGDGFEDGPPAGDAWSAISGEDWNEPNAIGVTSAWARTGTYSMRMNPDAGPSGIERTVLCVPNSVIWIDCYLSTPDAPDVGARLAIGVTIEEGGGWLSQPTYNSYYFEDTLVAEVGNAVKETGATPNTGWHLTSIKFKTGPQQTSFKFRFINFEGDIQHALMDDVTITTTGAGVDPWYPWVGTTLDRVTSPVDTGDWAFRFQVYDPTLTEFTQGIVQLMRTGANIDRLFTFKGRLRTNSGTPRMVIPVIKRGSGTWIRSKAYYPTNSGYIDFEISGIVDEDRFSVEIRDGQTGMPGGTAGPFIYVDTMEGYWGLGEQTTGSILQHQIEIIKARGVLTWLKTDSFDEFNDSNGVPWPGTEVMMIWHGMNLLQVLELFRRKGYEWDVVWNDSASMYELLVYYPYTMGGDLTATGLKFHAINIAGADIVEADPGANTFYGEGDTGIYSSYINTALEAGYGTRERWIDDPSSLTEDAMTLRLIKASSDAEVSKFSLVARAGAWFTPGLTALPGSLVKIELSGEVDDREERISRMMFTAGPDGEITTITFGSEFYGLYEKPAPALTFFNTPGTVISL